MSGGHTPILLIDSRLFNNHGRGTAFKNLGKVTTQGIEARTSLLLSNIFQSADCDVSFTITKAGSNPVSTKVPSLVPLPT